MARDIRKGGNEGARVQEEGLHEVAADLVHRDEQRVHAHAVAGEAFRRDGAFLDLHRELPLLVFIAHAAEQRDGSPDPTVLRMEGTDAEGDGQRPAGCGVCEDDVGDHPAASPCHAADHGACRLSAEAFAEDRAVIEDLTVQAAPAHHARRGEACQLFGGLVPEHDRARVVHDIQPVLHLVQESRKRNLGENRILHHYTIALPS